MELDLKVLFDLKNKKVFIKKMEDEEYIFDFDEVNKLSDNINNISIEYELDNNKKLIFYWETWGNYIQFLCCDLVIYYKNLNKNNIFKQLHKISKFSNKKNSNKIEFHYFNGINARDLKIIQMEVKNSPFGDFICKTPTNKYY